MEAKRIAEGGAVVEVLVVPPKRERPVECPAKQVKSQVSASRASKRAELEADMIEMREWKRRKEAEKAAQAG
jgi:hypothetical protein